MTDREKLIEVVRRAANACLPSNTEEFHLRMFVTHLLANGVTVKKHEVTSIRHCGFIECARNRGGLCLIAEQASLNEKGVCYYAVD